MTVDLNPDVEALVRRAVASGRLSRPEDAVQEALSLWAEQERRKAAAPDQRPKLTPEQAVAKLRELRKGNFLPPGVTIRDLIDEGRA